MSPINAFLLKHNLRIVENPCVSPDFCLDWPSLLARLKGGLQVAVHAKSGFSTADGAWTLLEDAATGDCAWSLQPGQRLAKAASVLESGEAVSGGAFVFPATFANLLRLKNRVQEHDPASTIFPNAAERLGQSTLGIGARFTTLHWPAVEWAMAALGHGFTANQNSIPRELVYDVDAMLGGRLDTVPFPFIGASVPEGHQGQSVEGMSHGCVLSKLKTGFHKRRIAWSFNADHQPIGGKFDAREDQLVAGCVLASYITFDLSPELASNDPRASARGHGTPGLIATRIKARVAAAGVDLDPAELSRLLGQVWPALQKMKRRDDKYRAARQRAFTTAVGREYLRELSIDELPGLTTAGTTAVMLAACEALDMKIHFIAPAFGFQKNTPYPDNAALRELIERQWEVCSKFGAGIGFHSGSGKSAENYAVMGKVTGGRLEIKTSGRYTYEMGRALAESADPGDRKLWRDWYDFTKEMALAGAFSADPTEQKMARSFIETALGDGSRKAFVPGESLAASATFDSPASCRAALDSLPPSPDRMFWFEYNFLYVLAAGGRIDKAALGDHTAAGYAQRARFYAISPAGRFRYARNVARYIVFLARSTGLCAEAVAQAADARLDQYASLDQMLSDICPSSTKTSS